MPAVRGYNQSILFCFPRSCSFPWRHSIFTSKHIWVASLGLGALWAWSYALFPSAGLLSPFMASAPPANLPNWHVSLVVGTVACLAVLGLRRVIRRPRVQVLLALLGAASQTICGACMLMPASSAAVGIVGGVGSGLAVGLLWICWFLVLNAMDAEDVEKVFVLALALNAPLFFVMTFAPGAVRIALFFLLAFVQLGSFLILSQKDDASVENEPPSLKDHLLRAGMARIYLCTATAFSFISFAGSCFASQAVAHMGTSYGLYTVGMMLGAAMLGMFIHFSPRIDIFESIRWVFPVVAFALVFGMMRREVLLVVAVMLMALCHIAFEGMTRLGILAAAKRDDASFMQVSALGLASISLGAFVGAVIFQVCLLWESDVLVLCAFALAALVGLVLLLFNGHDGVQRPTAALPNEELCIVIAERYALSPRETEVLGYLIEGRSAPFIRDELHISKGTVDTHVRHIYEKTGVSSKQELITLVNTVRDQGSQ